MAALQEAAKQVQSQLSMNSRYSRKPPSSDGSNKPAPRALRVEGQKPTGGQKGHPGGHLGVIDCALQWQARVADPSAVHQ